MITMALAAPTLTDLDWYVVNDTVMGGVSSSTVQVEDALTFQGELSLESNGGFTSIRSRGTALSLEGATAIRLELRGDGRTYDLTLRRSDMPLRAGSYRVQVPTTKAFTVVEVPLSAFRPTSYGRAVTGAPALDAALGLVESVGILLADGNPGPFRLEIRSLEPVVGATPRASSHGAVITTARDAISRGVMAFNAGDEEGCRQIYAGALEGVESDLGLTPGERAVITEALARSRKQGSTEAAWTLRHAIDTVLWSAP
jgi:NADH dehydrogenase [ubiquinone] 1 alpha subcomplex assembly factor 1